MRGQEQQLQAVVERLKTAAPGAAQPVNDLKQGLIDKNSQTTEVDLRDEISDLGGIATVIGAWHRLADTTKPSGTQPATAHLAAA